MKEAFITKEQAEEISRKYPTPFYIYSEAGIRSAVRGLKQAFSWNPGFREYFAVKACSNPFLIKDGLLLLYGADAFGKPGLSRTGHHVFLQCDAGRGL